MPKSIFPGSIFLILILLVSCSTFNLTDILAADPQISAFLSQFPNAEVMIVHLAAHEMNLTDFKEICTKNLEEPKAVYRVEIADPGTQLKLVAYLDSSSREIECVRKFAAGGKVENGQLPLPEPECTDSDGEIEHPEKIKGVVRGFYTPNQRREEATDSCMGGTSGDTLIEFFCEGKELKQKEITCTCNDGACQQEVTPLPLRPPTTPVPTPAPTPPLPQSNNTNNNDTTTSTDLCTDSDNGKNFEVKGTTKKGLATSTDSCDEIYPNSVWEYHCYSDGSIRVDKKACEYRCLDGACIQNPCGNGVVDSGENCATCPADASCSSGQTCQEGRCLTPTTTTTTCGNGKIEGSCSNSVYSDRTSCLIFRASWTGEQCDDGNVKSGDGCSPSCVIERRLVS